MIDGKSVVENARPALSDTERLRLATLLESAVEEVGRGCDRTINRLIGVLKDQRLRSNVSTGGYLLLDETVRWLRYPNAETRGALAQRTLHMCARLVQNDCDLFGFFWLLNELRSVRSRKLLSELVFAIPADHSANSADVLVSIFPTVKKSIDEKLFEDIFEKQLRRALSDASTNQDLESLASLCRNSIDADTHEYATIFWLTCACYLENLTCEQLLLSPAHRSVMRQIELIIAQHIRDADSPILSSDGIVLVENTLCNMMAYLTCVQPSAPLFDRLDSTFHMQLSLESIIRGRPAGNDSLFGAGLSELLRKIARLKLDVDATPDAKSVDLGEIVRTMEDVRDACTLFVRQALITELDSVTARLRTYQSGNGALSDLEHCVAVLIQVEDSLIKKFAVDDGEALATGEPEEGALDAQISAEMVAMLKPLTNRDELDQIDREWLIVALADIASLSAFQSDQFLCRNLDAVKTQIADTDTPLDLLQKLGKSVELYLLQYPAGDLFEDAKESLQTCINQLKKLRKRVEPPVDIAALARNNRDLLDIDEAEVTAVRLPVGDSVARADSIALEKGENYRKPVTSLEFGEQCNRYIDTIQLALDTALGSSGNLSPDSTVTTALDKLHQVVKSTEHTAMLNLIEPLSQVLERAEQADVSFSQADTLLIQEAIVAITIGIDAIANELSTPALVDDVARRITELAVNENQHLRGGFETAGLVDVFVEEAEDLAQRLFELFQRWRSAPQGASRLQSDIKRLLHTLKGSADTVAMTHIAALAHALETYLAKNASIHGVSGDFFDVSTEAVEVLLDDIDRARNRESILDRGDVIAQLGVALTASTNTDSLTGIVDSDTDSSSEVGDSNVAPLNGSVQLNKTPAFGSVKYFNKLENIQRRLSNHYWKSNELQTLLNTQLSDMQSALQSAQYLLGKSAGCIQTDHLARGIDESLRDLQHLQSQLLRALEQLDEVGHQQLVNVKDLESMIATTELVSVGHLELRCATLIQHLSESQEKAVRLEFTGGELELDRKHFGDLYKPVEQLIINAMVHGIESQSARARTAKDRVATIAVAFENLDDDVVVTVSDDGAGVDLIRLRQLAGQRASFDPAVSDAELLRSIVGQGVTTSPSANRNAGRGVGLDIVKEWVTGRYGSLAIETTEGFGTTFTLHMPRRTDSASVVVVRQGASLFAIDLDKVVEVKAVQEQGLSFAALTGCQSTDTRSTISCKTANGNVDINVDDVLGRRTMKFTNDGHFYSRTGSYTGCGVIDNNQIVFRVNLNKLLAAGAVQPAPAQHNYDEQSSVLIVDDSVTIRAAFGRAMQSAGYKIVLARNGVEAMEYLEAHQPEVIILDLEMPLMDGYELGSYISNEPRLKSSALVVVSSKPKSAVGDWLTAVNADAYYEKPCSESTIAGLVAELV